MSNLPKARNRFKDILEDGDYSHYYSESVELAPLNILPTSYGKIMREV